MMNKRLIFWGWFNRAFFESEMLPEIEKNCRENGIYCPAAYEAFQTYKDAPDCLVFFHSWAENDIQMGQEYQAVARMEQYELQPAAIQKCRAKVLCFFRAYKIQPVDYAMRGHHEFSFVRFEGGIPQMIYDELYEIKEFPLDMSPKQICLYETA